MSRVFKKRCHICNELIDIDKLNKEEGHCFEDTCPAKHKEK